MARKTGFLTPRKAIYVFWEGEREEVYTKYLKKFFSNKATIFIHGEKGTFHTALRNGKWVLERAGKDSMPKRSPDNTFESDRWLFKGTHTFTTVHEALEMLINLL